MQTHKLEELKTLGVSLVKNGANKRKFAIAKKEMALDVIKSVLEMEAPNEEMVDKMEDLSDAARDAVKAAMRALSAFSDEMPDDLMARLSELLGIEMPQPEIPAEPPELEIEMSQQADPEKLKLEEQLKSLWKSNEELHQKIALKEEISKAAELYAPLSKSADDLGKLMLRIRKHDAVLANDVEELLKSASRMIAEGDLFKEKGQSGSDAEKTANDRIEALAKSIDGMTKEQAIVHVMKTNPELYAAYKAERGI